MQASTSLFSCPLPYKSLAAPQLPGECMPFVRPIKLSWSSSLQRPVKFSSVTGLSRDLSMFSSMAFNPNVSEDTDDMYDELFEKYGKVVLRRGDKKPHSAEVDDDAESLAYGSKSQVQKKFPAICVVAVALAKVASDVKAADIRVLFVKPLVYWTRFFIIATAFSRPQIDAIGSRIRDLAEKQYGKVPSGDSKPNSWTLLDFGGYFELHNCGHLSDADGERKYPLRQMNPRITKARAHKFKVGVRFPKSLVVKTDTISLAERLNDTGQEFLGSDYPFKDNEAFLIVGGVGTPRQSIVVNSICSPYFCRHL
ncbi:Protein Iojap, chloroplastic [Vitis vinifera]|uniref:Protein Iojap, chloroplastic n=1 Tax=Vitis vinifera TaxID=29760 RepID=A0A438CJX8_VITVI|nr:Protein Iojap, chloroplastic [Vitis vinifera]